jgi:putative endonuclease
MTISRLQLGKLGEDAACSLLEAAGYRIIERNWRCRIGEIDTIAEHDGRTVFVEVRTRRSGAGRFGTAAESVDIRKQMKVRSTALVYMRSAGLLDSPVRFDVIAVAVNSDESIAECKHIEGAF